MFNLIVSGTIGEGRGEILSDRVFEYTSDDVRSIFLENNTIKNDKIPILCSMQSVFMDEGIGDGLVRIGKITRIHKYDNRYIFEYFETHGIPRFQNANIYEIADRLQIDSFEFHRNHWSIKEVDLFKVLYQHELETHIRPRIFQLSDRPIDRNLISLMMPFQAEFSSVYETIKSAVEEKGYVCRRADDFWKHDQVIQDIVELICISNIVICDLTGKNANVYYEAGIAHTIGKNVILITQHHNDVPFDLRHLRYIHYLNNREGREALANDIIRRIRAFR